MRLFMAAALPLCFLASAFAQANQSVRRFRSRRSFTYPTVHLANGYSLTEAAVRARNAGPGEMTAVAIFKRLRASEHWLRWLAKELGKARGWELPSGELRYRAVDATVIPEPGSTGTDWRLHYSLNLSDLQCDFFEITDVRGGETWRRVPGSPGDVLLGDRIYGTPTGVAHVLRAQGQVIARVNHNALPLFESSGNAFPVFRMFRTLRVGKTQQWKTYAMHEQHRFHGRLKSWSNVARKRQDVPENGLPEERVGDR